MKSYKGNKKRSNNKTKKLKHSAKLIKLDDRGTTLVVLKKNTPKSIIKKLFKNINKNDYLDLCKEVKHKKTHTFGKRSRGKRKGHSRRYMRMTGGSVAGPIGTFMESGKLLKIFFGNELFFLLGGASLATLLYAFKKVKLVPDLGDSFDDDIDYIEEKSKKAELCKETISNLSNKELKEPWTKPNMLCIKNRPRKGTTSQRSEMWVDYDLAQEEEDRQQRKQEDIEEKNAEATAAMAAAVVANPR
tara:strand:- start:98 stop:832 length:735 start_codon:yes stop_codon:yes gene_type:complete